MHLPQLHDLMTDSADIPNAKVLRIGHEIRERRDYDANAPWGRVRSLPGKIGPALFKFGRSDHLREALTHGSIRVSPATCYVDPSLNTAQRDSSELRQLLRPSRMSRPIVFTEGGIEVLNNATRPHEQVA